MFGAGPHKRITRGLRFRLTASYALFFTALLIGVGAFFRETLSERLKHQISDALNQDWAALKGYLRIENKRPLWFYDPHDPDEAFLVDRLRRVYLLADAQGRVMQYSETYRSIGFNPAAEIQATIQSGKSGTEIRTNAQGVPFLIRSGVIYDEKHHPYFVAIGRSLGDNRHVLMQFTWVYLTLFPMMVVGGCLLGWFVAGRALTPVLQVAQTAQRITSSNLSLRIPSREAGDELDYLIETFNPMIERLENSFRQIRQFSTDVSHELRTPLTAIRGQLEVALFNATTAEQYREAMLNALQDVERLSGLVRALLLLSQAESGQLTLQKTRIDLAALIREIVDHFQIPADEAGVTLEAELPPECPSELDRIQIERMLSNLLTNALKFTPAGGAVRVRLERRSQEVAIFVEDTGAGIAHEHLPHIFDRFYRVPESQAPHTPERGLGLGLSFVAWIVQAHGGTVDVKSIPGQGSCFTIVLPNLTPALREPTPVTGKPETPIPDSHVPVSL